MAVSQTETQHEVPVFQAPLIYDIHVCVDEVQQVCVSRQLLWYIRDVVANTLDGSRNDAQAAAGADPVAGEVGKCEDDEYEPQGACVVDIKIFILT